MNSKDITFRWPFLCVLLQGAGLSFCLIWAASILAFPYEKGSSGAYIAVILGASAGMLLSLRSVKAVLNSWISYPGSGRFLLWMILIGLALRIFVIMIQPVELKSDQLIYHSKALELLKGEGYGPTAFLPPGFPMILAGWYWAIGPNPTAGFLLGALLGTAAIPLAYEAGRRIASHQAARWAALLTAIFPSLVLSSPSIHTTSILVVCVLGIVVLTLRADKSKQPFGWSTIGLGAIIGLGSLVKPIFLFVPIMILLNWISVGLNRTRIWKLVLVIVIASCFVAPWTLRNYFVLNAFVPVSTNGGYVLYHGMNPNTCGMWSSEFDSLKTNDEVESNRIARDTATTWMRNHPMQCLSLICRKQAFMWGTSSTSLGYISATSICSIPQKSIENCIKVLINTAWTLLMALCFKATLSTRIWQKPCFALCALWIFYVFGSHLFFEVQSRYHVSVIPILIVIASSVMAVSCNRSNELHPIEDNNPNVAEII